MDHPLAVRVVPGVANLEGEGERAVQIERAMRALEVFEVSPGRIHHDEEDVACFSAGDGDDVGWLTMATAAARAAVAEVIPWRCGTLIATSVDQVSCAKTPYQAALTRGRHLVSEGLASESTVLCGCWRGGLVPVSERRLVAGGPTLLQYSANGR